MLGFFAFQD